mgnify:CR=1 FL=1
MPERKNRTRRSMLWVCALAAMVLLAALPATAAWYATQSAAGGSAIETATFEVEADTRPQTESASLTPSDLADLTEKYGEDAVNAFAVRQMTYQTTVVTVTADRENTASGYVIVTYNNSENYYSGFVAPGESVCFTVPGGTVRGSDGEITVSGEDASGKTYRNEFVIEAGWGRPEGELKLKDLRDALNAQTDSLIARQKKAYLEKLAAQLEQAKQAAEEAARKAAEEAANQAGQNTGAATTEPTGVFTGS